MSTALTVRWVFGYYDPTGNRFGLNDEQIEGLEDEGILVEAAECCGGPSGHILFVRKSVMPVVHDRDGYDVPRAVFLPQDLPPTAEFTVALASAFPSHLPWPTARGRPEGSPQWMLHTDVG